jgi:hypothetical protein
MGYLDSDVRLQQTFLSGHHGQAVINMRVSFRYVFVLSARIPDSDFISEKI